MLPAGRTRSSRVRACSLRDGGDRANTDLESRRRNTLPKRENASSDGECCYKYEREDSNEEDDLNSRDKASFRARQYVTPIVPKGRSKRPPYTVS